jgi:hypothetical protein
MRLEQQQPWMDNYAASMRALLEPIYEQNRYVTSRLFEAIRPSLDTVKLVDTSALAKAVGLNVPRFDAASLGISAYAGQ